MLGRRLLGGDNEKLVQELFASVHISQAVNSELGEPNNQNILEGRFLINNSNNSNNEKDYSPFKCYKYSREYKLIEIEYF